METLLPGGVTMAEVEELLKDIEKLSDRLQKLIFEKHESLTDKDVVATSKMLNAIYKQFTNKYYNSKMYLEITILQGGG